MKPFIFLNSHPIQYFTPLYKLIYSEKKIDLNVIYCSDETVNGSIDKEFGVTVKWDTPLLDGYPYVFLKNHSFKPSIFNGFWGLLNWGVFKKLFNEPPSLIIVHGWGYATHLIALIFARMFNHTVCLRAETPLHQEFLKNKYVISIKHFLLKKLFTRIDYFLYIGSENKKFYNYLGVNENQLLFTPYCVDNKFFSTLAKSSNKDKLKHKIGIPIDFKVILYAGKYIDKKRPLDLINAFAALNDPSAFLIMVGDGKLREAMEELILTYQIKDRVILTGFINQSIIYEYYAIADVFVMCSGLGETWGLSANEAMNFGVPLVLSSTTGSSSDLVIEGVNGFTFPTGNIHQLTAVLNKTLQFNIVDRARTIETHNQLLNKYSYNTIINSLKTITN